jgi:hypothetical protein
MVDAFLAALQSADFERLVAVLDPDVLVRIDEAAARRGAPRDIRGARNWAQGAVAFSQMARFAQVALVDGSVGIVFVPDGKLSRVLRFTIVDGRLFRPTSSPSLRAFASSSWRSSELLSSTPRYPSLHTRAQAALRLEF